MYPDSPVSREAPENRNHQPIGEVVGHEAFTDAEDHGENYCRHERQRIELANQPLVLALRARYEHLAELERDLEDRITRAPMPGDQETRRRKSRWYRALFALLAVSAFAFLVLGFAPFNLGWLGWLYSFGIAVLTPLLVDKTVEAWGSTAVWKAVVVTGCVAALGAQMLLAVVRGDIMREQLTSAAPAVVIEGETAAPAERGGPGFYERNSTELQLVMLLFALGLELGAGIALREARRWGVLDGEDREVLWTKLGEVRELKAACGLEAARLKGAGAAFEEEFRRDFRRAILTRVREGVLQRFPIFLLALALLGGTPGEAAEQQRLNLIVAVDLTKSVTATKGYDGTSEFTQNVEAVSRLLAQVPAGAKITVIGITDSSFSRPYILLSAEIDRDEGYFRERIGTARKQLVRTWQRRAASARADFVRSDVFGAVLLAGEFLREGPGRRNILVILSDMRHDMPDCDLAEKPGEWRKCKPSLLPQLNGTDVYVLGVHAAGKNEAYWNELRDFWGKHFAKSGATMRSFSILRESPNFAVEPGQFSFRPHP